MMLALGATNIGYIKERKQFTTHSELFHVDSLVLQIQDISKNESNSQLSIVWSYNPVGATNIGYIKERKQFTTARTTACSIYWCYKYRIYQRTKAIHNSPLASASSIRVLQIQDISKNESNSQPGSVNACFRMMVLQIQDISKNESNSQHVKCWVFQQMWCYKYRIYQRTKAIHNSRCAHLDSLIGATNIGYIKERKQFTTRQLSFKKTYQVLQIQDISKNESNSQHDKILENFGLWCYKYRIYQRTKAIHNLTVSPKAVAAVLQIQDISKNESNSQLTLVSK